MYKPINKWNINKFSCTIPENIKNVKQMVCLNLNKAKLFGDEAMYLNKFSELNPDYATIGLYTDLFYYVAECAAKEASDIINGLKKKKKKEKKKNNG